jgi:hypothetical protein
MLALFSINFFVQAEEVRDDSTGVTFPKEISINEEGKSFNLKATGVATRKKFFVKVYSIAHYLQDNGFQNKGDIVQAIMDDNYAKQFTMKWVHEASSSKIQEGYYESFKNTLGADYSRLEGQINQFVKLFNRDAQKGDEYILQWLPGGKIEVIFNGSKAGTVVDKNFAVALWNLWFGSKSVVKKSDLTSLVH